MSYISRIKNEFLGQNHSTIWESITKRTYGSYDHLIHPCRVDKRILQRYLPESMKPDEILPLVQEKKKQLAKQYSIKKFPPDREPGFIGQAALFAVVQETIEDLSYYFNSDFERGDNTWLEGFGLFDTLIAFTQIRRLMGFDDIDILQAIFESRSPSKVIIKLERIWLYRLFTNISSLTPRITDNELSCEIMKNLVKVQDAWGLTIGRIRNWTGLSQRKAKFFQTIVAATGYIHRTRLVSKNTGIVRQMKMNSSLSNRLSAEDMLCSSWGSSEKCFASVNYHWRDEIDNYFDFEAYIQNIDNYDHGLKSWTIPDHPSEIHNIDELAMLFDNSDLTLPDNSAEPSQRDLLIIGLLASMPVEFHPNWKYDVMERLVKGCGVPQDEAELGFRNVFRKHMVRHQYTFAISNDRSQLLILFNDEEKKTIPFLAQVLSSIPACVLWANYSLTNGMVNIYYPKYLADDMQNYIMKTLNESDMNVDVYDILEHKLADTSNIFSLMKDVY